MLYGARGSRGQVSGLAEGEYNEFLVLLFYPIQSESRPARSCIPFDIDDLMHMHVGVCEYDTSFFSSLCCCCLPRHNIDPLVFLSQLCRYVSLSVQQVGIYRPLACKYCIDKTRTLSIREKRCLLISFHSFIHLFIFRQFVGRIHCSIEDTTTSSL